MGRKFTLEKRVDMGDMRNSRVHAGKEDGMWQTSCEEMGEEHTRDIGNYIDPGNRTIWDKAPLQVY